MVRRNSMVCCSVTFFCLSGNLSCMNPQHSIRILPGGGLEFKTVTHAPGNMLLDRPEYKLARMPRANPKPLDPELNPQAFFAMATAQQRNTNSTRKNRPDSSRTPSTQVALPASPSKPIRPDGSRTPSTQVALPTSPSKPIRTDLSKSHSTCTSHSSQSRSRTGLSRPNVRPTSFPTKIPSTSLFDKNLSSDSSSFSPPPAPPAYFIIGEAQREAEKRKRAGEHQSKMAELSAIENQMRAWEKQNKQQQLDTVALQRQLKPQAIRRNFQAEQLLQQFQEERKMRYREALKQFTKIENSKLGRAIKRMLNEVPDNVPALTPYDENDGWMDVHECEKLMLRDLVYRIKTALLLGVEFNSVLGELKGMLEAVVGKDFTTGHELCFLQRILLVFCSFVPKMGNVIKGERCTKAFREFCDFVHCFELASSTTNHISEIARGPEEGKE